MAGWTCVEEIIAYQRSVELRDMVLALIDSGQIPHNFHLRDQIAAAARSVPANIAEGFDRYKHGQFGYHVGVAKGSLGELKTHLGEAVKRGFVSQNVFTSLLKRIEETRRLTSGLLRHLGTTDAPTPWQDPKTLQHDSERPVTVPNVSETKKPSQA